MQTVSLCLHAALPILLRLAPLARREGLAWTWRRHLSRHDLLLALLPLDPLFGMVPGAAMLLGALLQSGTSGSRDRKSTRLNSSHVAITYAVFCLRKKI